MKKYLKEINRITSSSGNTVPLQREAFKHGFSFSNLPSEEQLPIWDYIWKTTNEYRTDMFCLYFLESIMKNEAELISSWECIKVWQDKISRWETSDSLSKIYAQLVEYTPKEMLSSYEKWNNSISEWKRRQSIVGLLYYSSSRKKYLPYEILIPFIKNLLADEAYYVQKGIGWTLREIGNIYSVEQEKFMFENSNQISGIAFSAATEKWGKDIKEELKKKRKADRK